MQQIEIKNLHVSTDGEMILKGLDLVIKQNEIHALMGPNGNGKSTLLSTIMGHPNYKVEQGDILFDGESILDKTVDERSKLGIFFAMQSPVEIPGVLNLDFLKTIINAHRETPIKLPDLYKTINENTKNLKIEESMIQRYLNSGFSGGEKKKNEILQLNVLTPSFALIDEIDSGLDVDALNVVSGELNKRIGKDFAALIVSHYDRFFNLVKPTHAHVIIKGKIVKSGDYQLVEKINQEGYEWLMRELKIDNVKNEDQKRMNTAVGCAAKNAK
ncbi:Fe-S cluster assembly ATPase SufC [Spiroplasma eriocheiris]|uniref:FeS assembly ATPase SufC n=1 Tax=Spiroplasma eriocheiris TaxID=315358 RepID=A0A0H3XIL0_9MOLU|nr:Fe-S cluster assembly ATPase SufC [Spiroplasma eriocheiris]AHF58276.1 ABC-type iron-sulfur cluster assembly transport system ATP-binding protein [Spiroplasma eriocheiris CCTCC M 207170]AKM54713.1 FeS assembly ATPase SufC [Spiroplasma eriocheiris]